LVRASGSGGCTAANLADADFAKAYDSKGAACSDGYAATAPTGHYAAAGGVYDIDGNVREWVNACGNGAAASGGCRDHRYRGRAWLSPDKEPVSFADSASSDVAGNTIGFRVAREIEQK
jgi:formylglycine-generating enzyme required for sulfatase activity